MILDSPLLLYRVLTIWKDSGGVFYVRAEDPGKAIRYVRNMDQQFYNNYPVRFYVEVQDDSKGIVFQ